MALACAVIAMGGCSTNQQSTAYKTIFGLEKTVAAADSAYLDLVIAGKVPTNDVPKVTKAFNQFQADVTLALDAVQFNTNALASASLITESQDILNVINTAKGLK